jgi:diguanylate cyclase (GGDEF)-like protein
MLASSRYLNRMVALFAATAACAVAILPPAGYFFISYRYLQGALETEAAINASLVSGLVVNSPEYWRYQTLRLEELLRRCPHDGHQETCLVTDMAGKIIASKAGDPPRPLICRSHAIYDVGTPVARIEVRQSLRPLLFRSALLMVVSSVLGALLFFVVRLVPMGAIAAANRSLSESELKYRSLFTNMSEAVLLLEVGPELSGALIREANPACGGLFATDYRTLAGCYLNSLLGSSDAELLPRFRQVARDAASITLDFPCMGRILTFSVTPAEQGRVAVMVSDVTDYRAKDHRIQQLTFYDSLTGLPNRALLRDRLKQAIAGCERDGKKIAVILLGMDNFKAVNETLGHEAGNRLLQAIAERLRNSVRRADTVARLGGDEFVILLLGMSRELNASQVARTILNQMGEPFQVADRYVFTGCTIGISIYPDDSSSDTTLLANAAMALNSAKEKGRNRYSYYSQELNRKAMERMGAETFLRFALINNWLSLAYQPQVNARTGAINGIEVLLRADSPDSSERYSASRIVAIAEETGLIVPIGEWVFMTACTQARRWLDEGVVFPRLAVNLSAKQFELPALVSMVRDILQKSGIPPAMVEFELTESAIIRQPEEAGRKLRELKKLGVSLAVDDFCTGYSSLNYLKDFPIDRVKIDRSFVRDACSGGRSAAIVEAVIALAAGLGLDVIAEGVERRGQMEYLLSRGCEEMQGYYFARPMPPEQCVELLAEGRVKGLRDGLSLSSDGVKQWTFIMKDRLRSVNFDVISE